MSADDLDDPLQARFANHVDTVYRSLDTLHPRLHEAVDVVCDTLLGERRLLVGGLGSGAALAQIFCTALLSRSHMERPGLPVSLIGNDAATLGAITEHYGLADVLARQVQALAQPGDTLLLICGSAPATMSAAVRAARLRQARVLSISGEGGGDAGLAGEADLELRIPAEDPARVSECQLLVLNCLVEMTEQRLFGAG